MSGKYKVYLASGSPRRRELLKLICDEYSVLVSNAEEVVTSSDPATVVKELSMLKAQAVFEELVKKEGEKFLVIGSDTVVANQGKILGKPVDAADAALMINSLQGHDHSVFTGVTVLFSDGVETINFAEESKVSVYPMTQSEILSYIATKEPMDKAGAYAIQGLFAPYIKGIEGDYNTIVGLPVARLYQEMKKYNIFLA